MEKKVHSNEYKRYILRGIVLILPLFFIYISLLITRTVSAQEAVNKIVASVAGEPITYYDVLVAMYPQLQEANLVLSDKNDIRIKRLEETALNEIVNAILIRQEADKYNLKITEQDIDSEMRRIARENNTSVDVLEQQIRLQGNSVDMIKKNLRNSLLQQRMIATFVFRKIVVTAQEIESYYKEHSDMFKTDTVYSVLFIKLPTEREAERVLAQGRSRSTSFASLQKSCSERYGSSSVGELEDLMFSELSSEWQTAISDANQGDIIGPLHVDNEYFVVYVRKKEDGSPLPFEDVYTTIEGKIRDSKFSSQYADFIQSLRAKADIKIYQ